jgi:dTMP kinase
MSRGWFITFEGGEGTGKSTQIEMLAGHLRGQGLTVVVTREPGGTPVAEAVRAVLLDPSLAPDGLTELFLLEAARRDHVEHVIRPAVERGRVVLSDRFADSSTVYQGMVRGVGVERVVELNRIATGGLDPDVTVVLDFDHESGLQRARSRNAEGDGSESRLDDEPSAFHRRVREGFLQLAENEPERVRVVSAEGPHEEVFARVLAALPEDLQ